MYSREVAFWNKHQFLWMSENQFATIHRCLQTYCGVCEILDYFRDLLHSSNNNNGKHPDNTNQDTALLKPSQRLAYMLLAVSIFPCNLFPLCSFHKKKETGSQESSKNINLYSLNPSCFSVAKGRKNQYKQLSMLEAASADLLFTQRRRGQQKLLGASNFRGDILSIMLHNFSA